MQHRNILHITWKTKRDYLVSKYWSLFILLYQIPQTQAKGVVLYLKYSNGQSIFQVYSWFRWFGASLSLPVWSSPTSSSSRAMITMVKTVLKMAKTFKSWSEDGQVSLWSAAKTREYTCSNTVVMFTVCNRLSINDWWTGSMFDKLKLGFLFCFKKNPK